MNKVFLGLILAVCVLGMALVMLNDRLGRKTDVRQPQQTAQPLPRSPEDLAAAARALEMAQAKSALEESGETERKDRAAQPALAERLPEPLPRPAVSRPPAPKPEVAKPAQREPEPPRPAPVAEVKPAKPEPVRPEPVKPEAPRPETPKPESRPEAVKTDAKKGSMTATKFVIYAREKGATVRIGGNGKVDYSSMTLEEPNRVVLDLAGEWKFPPHPGVPKNDLVSAVRVGQNGDKTRVVIDLKEKPRKVILVPFKNGDGVDVRVDK